MNTALLQVLEDTRKFLALPDNTFVWSSWQGVADAVAELDEAIAAVRAGAPAPTVLYLPTGPLQEVAISSGWGEEFLVLATRFDEAYTNPANL